MGQPEWVRFKSLTGSYGARSRSASGGELRSHGQAGYQPAAGCHPAPHGLIVAILAIAACSMAANVTTLEGVVRDASGAIVPKAEVSCVGESTGFRFTAQTGLDGRYAMSLPEGRYDIVVRHSGFRRAAQVGVHVASKNAIHVDFEIVPENVSDSDTIREAIEPDGKSSQTDSSDTVIRPDDVHGLPRNDNTVMGLLALSPGVLYTPASR